MKIKRKTAMPELRVCVKTDIKTGETFAVLPKGEGASLMIPVFSIKEGHSACSFGYLLTDVRRATGKEAEPVISMLRTLYPDKEIVVTKNLPCYAKM